MAEFADRNDQEKFYKGHYGITGTFVQKIKEGKAVIAYSDEGIWAGFCLVLEFH